MVCEETKVFCVCLQLQSCVELRECEREEVGEGEEECDPVTMDALQLFKYALFIFIRMMQHIFVHKQGISCVQSKTWCLSLSQTCWLRVSMHSWLWPKCSG